MKLIVAGGRDWRDVEASRLALYDIYVTLEGAIEEVVVGGARGADAIGEAWARERKIPVKVFAADWDKHGRAAGPIRNREMAEYVGPGGYLVLFPGGDGTASMAREARRAGIPESHVFDRRGLPLPPPLPKPIERRGL